MNETQLQNYKSKLEKEKDEVVAILQKLGTRVDHSDSYVPKVADFGDDVTEFEDEEADEAEEFGRRVGIVETLVARLQDISAAFSRIKRKTFGVCGDCGENIETKVLDANPAAALCITCKKKV